MRNIKEVREKMKSGIIVYWHGMEIYKIKSLRGAILAKFTKHWGIIDIKDLKLERG